MEQEFADAYCWSHGTFTIKELADVRVLEEVVHPGMGYFDERVHTKLYHSNYKWVPLFLFLTAIAFYLPRAVWKKLEKGLVAQLSSVGEMEGPMSEECLRWLANVCGHFERARLSPNLYLFNYYLIQASYPGCLACVVSFLFALDTLFTKYADALSLFLDILDGRFPLRPISIPRSRRHLLQRSRR